MHPLLRLTMTFLRCLPAWVRSRNQQALVELALRQQLVQILRTGHRVDQANWNRASADGIQMPMAEWDCREMGRERSPRTARSRDRAERRPPTAPPPRVRRVLQQRPVHIQLQDSPIGRPAEQRPSPEAQSIGLPRVGSLHHRYEWQEAARFLRLATAKPRPSPPG
jgi:hypothetical protein